MSDDVWDKPGDSTPRGAALEARAVALFGDGNSLADRRSHLIGMYQGIVQALRPLTTDPRIGRAVSDYGFALIDDLLTQAEEMLATQPPTGCPACWGAHGSEQA